MHPDQMAALLAVADTGSFERAASTLAVSTSAVSQRIRALESSLGRVLIQRGSPSRVTAQGATVLRYARQQQLLAGEMSAELGLGSAGARGDGPGPGAQEAVEIAVAVNLDSLATWFPSLFPEIAHWPDIWRPGSPPSSPRSPAGWTCACDWWPTMRAAPPSCCARAR